MASSQVALLSEEEALAIAIQRSTLDSTPTVAGPPQAYYVIYSCCSSPWLVGIHQATWPQLLLVLPGWRSCGSGASNCKKFTDVHAAAAYFYSKQSEPTAVRLHQH